MNHSNLQEYHYQLINNYRRIAINFLGIYSNNPTICCYLKKRGFFKLHRLFQKISFYGKNLEKNVGTWNGKTYSCYLVFVIN